MRVILVNCKFDGTLRSVMTFSTDILFNSPPMRSVFTPNVLIYTKVLVKQKYKAMYCL